VKRRAKIFIGTSGWHYKHWRGPFYPDKLPASKMLEFYAQRFDTVELNNTFYRLPQPNGLNNWHDSTPREFRFAMKGSRFLTHMKKLKDPATGIERFFERADLLKEKLGPIVFQLPPHWTVDAERLDAFLKALPRAHRYAFELRNPTWHSAEIYAILRRHRAAFCIFEIAGFRSSRPTSPTSVCTVRMAHIKAVTPSPPCASGPTASANGKTSCAQFTFISITIRRATLRKMRWSWRNCRPDVVRCG
jgi:uncharacterized protein YecE (DUF72 family)